MFDADDIRLMLNVVSLPLKAMILLGVNCGFGNMDCGMLPLFGVDLDQGWINFPRPKAAIERRCPLWSKTVTALRVVVEARPARNSDIDSGLVFVIKYGQSWAKQTSTNPISAEFRKLAQAIDTKAAEKTKQEGGNHQRNYIARDLVSTDCITPLKR